MSKIDVIRAWKDPSYRSSLSQDQLGALPASPAGPMELSDEDLEMVAGGDTWGPTCSTVSLSCSGTTDYTIRCVLSC